MKGKSIEILKRIHFVALGIVLINAFCKWTTSYSLVENLDFGIKLLILISGFILFFFYLKPFQKISYYFSLYAASVFLVLISFVFRGFFWVLVLSLIYYPFFPAQQEFEENGIAIYTPFQGIVARCCTYQIKERQYLIFEKDYGKWDTEGSIDFQSLKVISDDRQIQLKFTTSFGDEVTRIEKK